MMKTKRLKVHNNLLRIILSFFSLKEKMKLINVTNSFRLALEENSEFLKTLRVLNKYYKVNSNIPTLEEVKSILKIPYSDYFLYHLEKFNYLNIRIFDSNFSEIESALQFLKSNYRYHMNKIGLEIFTSQSFENLENSNFNFVHFYSITNFSNLLMNSGIQSSEVRFSSYSNFEVEEKENLKKIFENDFSILSHLDLTGNVIGLDSYEYLKTTNLSNLKYLNLSGISLPWKDFSNCFNLKNLTTLILYSCCLNKQNIEEICSIGLQNLTSLDLSNNHLEPKTIEHLVKSLNLSKLVLLNYGGNSIDLEAMKILSKIKFTNLETLIFYNIEGFENETIKLFASISFPRLETLKISNNKISDKASSALEKMVLPCLKHLYIDSCGIDNKSMNYLKRMNLNNLTHLDLGSNYMIYETFMSFVKMSLPKLKYLRFVNNYTHLHSMKLMKLPFIEEFYFSDNNIDSLAIKEFAKIKYKNLKKLIIVSQKFDSNCINFFTSMKLDKLEYLHLSGKGILLDDLKKLGGMGLSNLKFLYIEGINASHQELDIINIKILFPILKNFYFNGYKTSIEDLKQLETYKRCFYY